jgi:hypothetical protein
LESTASLICLGELKSQIETPTGQVGNGMEVHNLAHSRLLILYQVPEAPTTYFFGPDMVELTIPPGVSVWDVSFDFLVRSERRLHSPSVVQFSFWNVELQLDWAFLSSEIPPGSLISVAENEAVEFPLKSFSEPETSVVVTGRDHVCDLKLLLAKTYVYLKPFVLVQDRSKLPDDMLISGRPHSVICTMSPGISVSFTSAAGSVNIEITADATLADAIAVLAERLQCPSKLIRLSLNCVVIERLAEPVASFHDQLSVSIWQYTTFKIDDKFVRLLLDPDMPFGKVKQKLIEPNSSPNSPVLLMNNTAVNNSTRVKYLDLAPGDFAVVKRKQTSGEWLTCRVFLKIEMIPK